VEDDALTKHFLETTIRNFGENPIRIYDGKGVEGHPLEALKSLMDGKDWDKFLNLLEAIKPCSGLLIPDTNLGENDRHREVSDDKATSYVFH